MSQWTLYALSSMALVTICFYGVIARAHLIRKILALNILGSSIFLLLVSIAYRNAPDGSDAVPQAMVLTGIVVAVSATAFALALARRVYAETGQAYLPEDAPEPETAQEEHVKLRSR